MIYPKLFISETYNIIMKITRIKISYDHVILIKQIEFLETVIYTSSIFAAERVNIIVDEAHQDIVLLLLIVTKIQVFLEFNSMLNIN
jgi:hypothetical protein